LYPAPNRRSSERILNYSSFFVSACIRSLLIPRHDLVIATSPQLLVGLSGWLIGRLAKCPSVFEVRDLWPESLLASGVSHERSALIRILDRISAFLYKHSDRIVVVTESFRDNLVQCRDVPRSKVNVITNAVDTDLFDVGPSRELIRASLNLRDRFVLSYVGTIGLAHGLETLLTAARNLKKALPQVLFLIIGEGADKERLRNLATEWKLDNVQFLDQRPREEIPKILAACDACLVMLRRSELFKTVLPSKMFEILAAGRPVILAVDGESRKLLEQAEGGIYVEPEDSAALTVAITSLVENPDECRRLGQNGRKFVFKNFSRDQTALDYLSILQSVQKGS